MKALSGFLLIALSLLSFDAVAAAVATTAGNNLTAYNPSGYISNNNWNNLMNSRSYMTSANAPTADFGNCNAVILRCAQPKCAGGGCTSMDLARTIVSGCVQSNESCKEYGDDLIEYISAQLVADSNAKANQAALEAQTAAAQAAQQQSAQQIQAMQAQMQQQNAEVSVKFKLQLQISSHKMGGRSSCRPFSGICGKYPHSPRYFSIHSVISRRRRTRLRGLPERESSWFSPLKMHILAGTPWLFSA